ncbi:MAG TPA: hypothetical protein VJ023_02965 [Pyrinomonadaceae bacterium]|nr:hypothetical protein [Pyrinomonadaceae bacterium]
MSATSAVLLTKLDKARNHFEAPRESRLVKVLGQLARHTFTEPEHLLRYHESLLFIRAYPPSAKVLRRVDRELKSFDKRVKKLTATQTDLSGLEVPENSGIVGTSVTDTFSYFIVRWLLERHPQHVSFYWDWFEDENRLAETWPRFMPLLAEDATVEANVPYREWLRLARGKRTELRWVLERFQRMPLKDEERAELYNSQKLFVNWTPPFRATRTGMRLPRPKPFYHTEFLIQRRDINFRKELQQRSFTIEQLSEKEGSRILDMAREASTVRYRELYGFTHGDSTRVLHVRLDRGVELFISGVPPSHRLPLRVYHAAMIFKNGVPVGYFEGLSLSERMESGFNLYYTFREGETAWIYARTLSVFHHLLGVTAFAIDPYQIGHENEEGIESGAFWFYHKLGFRPTRPELLKLATAEEKKIQSRRSYRTPPAVLRRLASGPMIFELDETTKGAWDRFSVRKVGFKAQAHMAQWFDGDVARFRKSATAKVALALSVSEEDLSSPEVSDLIVVLGMIEDLADWTAVEKDQMLRLLRAKTAPDEARYLSLTKRHKRFRKELIELGSSVR